MRYARYAIFILLSLPLFGSPVTLSAQVGGQVLSEEGAAVSDVRVDIYDANRSRIATRLTGLDGRFLFDSMPSRRGATILLRRVGFTPTTANIAAGDTALSFVMHPVAVSLAEVTTFGAQRRCPQKDDGEARALWAAVASRYYPMPFYVDLMATVRERTGDVPPENVGVPADESLKPGWKQYGADANIPSSALSKGAYAVSTRRGDSYASADDAYFAWYYPRFDSYRVGHFIDPQFSARHSLRMQHDPDGSTIIMFCPLQRALPDVEGTLRVSADSAFVGASWAFVTPRPHEEAGGEVTLRPPARVGPSMLLPATGVFWRRLGGHDYFYEQANVFLTWIAGGSDTLRVDQWRRPN